MSNQPVIVGVAQVVQRPGEVALDKALGPIELMVRAVQEAASDAGAPSLLEMVGHIGVAGGWFKYHNPGQLIAERIGSPGAATALSAVSGSAPQDLVALACERIAAGQLDVALVVGGEARWSHQKLSRGGSDPHWLTDPGVGDPETLSSFPDSIRDEARTLGSATAAYALFEDSLRTSLRRSVDEQRAHIAALWSRFSSVAAGNRFAWDRTPHNAEIIAMPTSQNRMVAFPYTKAMVANNTVDMATAVIVCNDDVARRLSIGPDRWVYPAVVTGAHETWLITERKCLHETPALSLAGEVAYGSAGVGPSDIAHLDLYACFPSVVEMSCTALDIDPDRPLTLTGGLGFAGAPVGNAVGHALAAMVEAVRGGGVGLVHGNGGFATKHSVGIYANEPMRPFERINVADQVEHHSRRGLEADWSGPVTVEAATVVYDREGPSHVLASVVSETGCRGFATAADRSLCEEVERSGIAGRDARRNSDLTLTL